MRRIFYSAVVAAMTIAPANAQAPQPAGTGITTATYNLINCAVAQNAGDVRWLRAIALKSAGLSPSAELGAMKSAIEGMAYGCPSEGADPATAIKMAISLVQVHPNSENRPRSNYALADCLAKAAPKEALAYVEQSDKVTAEGGQSSAVDYNPMFKASNGCGAELTKLNNKIQANELYSRLNWVLRAQPALAAQQTPTKAAGQ